MADELALALIGCGGMMGAHVNGYKALWEAGLRDFRIVATCDIDAGRADDFAGRIEEFQGSWPTVYTDTEKMLAAESGLDAVDISVVHNQHHNVAIPCIEGGKHVTIEKPVAITCRSARAMIDAAAKAGRVLQTAENYRRSPEERAVNWALKTGRIGEPRMIYWMDVTERLFHWGWREDRDLAGGGWSMDGGVHFADLFLYHIGAVKSLFALSRAYTPVRYEKPDEMTGPIDVTVEDSTFAIVEFENGVTGQWTYTSAAPGTGFMQRAVYGTEGSLTWGQGIRLRSGEETSTEDLVAQHSAAMSEEERENFFPGGVTDTIATELWNFMQAVRGEGKLEIDGVEGLRALALSMAIYESSALGRPVDISAIENCEIENYQADLNQAAGF